MVGPNLGRSPAFRTRRLPTEIGRMLHAKATAEGHVLLAGLALETTAIPVDELGCVAKKSQEGIAV